MNYPKLTKKNILQKIQKIDCLKKKYYIVLEMNTATYSPSPIPSTSSKKKGIHTLNDIKESEIKNEIPINTDFKIVKNEHFDTDVMNAILNDQSISVADRKRLSMYNRTRASIGIHEVVYHYAKGFEKDQIGRLYAKSKQGLQSFPFDIRNPLLSKYYWDVDMENCHYVILAHYADRLKLNTKPIWKYINNRNEELKKVSDNRTIGKVAFLKIPYGGSISLLNEFRGDGGVYSDIELSPEADLTLLYEIKSVMENIVDIVWSRNEHLQYLVSKKTHNKKYCLLAHILQTEERKAILALDAYLTNKKRNVDILIHDGCEVRKLENEEDFPTELLKGGEEAIYKATNCKHKLVIKPITPYIFKHKIKEYVSSGIIIDDLYATRHLVKLLNGKIYIDTSGGNRIIKVFNDSNGLWEEGENALATEITNRAKELIFYQQYDGKDRVYNFGGTIKSKNAIIDRIKDIKELYKPFNSGADTSKYKLLFKDGIYDAKERTFTEGFDEKVIFNGRIERDCPKWLYTDFDDSEESIRFQNKIKETLKILFKDTFTEEQIEGKVNDFYAIGLARALLGECEAKRFYVGVGETNSGKGLLTNALQQSFNSYVGTFQISNLCVNPNNSDDNAKKLMWLKPIYNQRLTISNEADAEKRISGALLATCSSGGMDTIQIRVLRENAIDIIVRTTFLILANDIPKITSAGSQIKERSCIVEYHKSFIDNPNPNNPNQMLIKPELLSYFNDDENKDSLVVLLIKLYQQWKDQGGDTKKPLMLEEGYNEWVGDVNSVKGVLKGGYEITNNEEDFERFNEISAYLKNKGIKDSDTKIGKELKKIGLVKGTKKIGCSSCAIYFGIKRIREEME